MSDLRDMAARLRAAADALDAVQGIEIDLGGRSRKIDFSQAANPIAPLTKRHITAAYWSRTPQQRDDEAAISRARARRRRAAKKA